MPNQSNSNHYAPSHPWYYLLGGDILKPSAILAEVKTSGYRGYLSSQIEKSANKSEPQRSIELRKLDNESRSALFSDISRYRECVRELRLIREQHNENRTECLDIHVSISLKHNHIYNDFAHLIRLDELLSEQPDLFTDMISSQQRGGCRER